MYARNVDTNGNLERDDNMKHPKESNSNIIYQKMLDNIFKVIKQKLLCTADQKWDFHGEIDYPKYHDIRFKLKYHEDIKYSITGVCDVSKNFSLDEITFEGDISDDSSSDCTYLNINYHERKYLGEFETIIYKILKNNRSYRNFYETYERYTKQDPFQYVSNLIKNRFLDMEVEEYSEFDWVSYHYTGEYKNDSFEIFIDNSDQFFDDEEDIPFDRFEIYTKEFQLSFKEEQSEKIRGLCSLLKTQSIPVENFLIRTTIMHCINREHHLQRIKALVYIDTGREIRQEEVEAEFCIECNQYFITEIEYQKLCKKGRVCCRVITLSEYQEISKVKDFNLAGVSLLRSYGYNVNAQINLSDAERKRILSFIVENQIESVDRIIGFIEWLIRRNSSVKLQVARLKWNRDLDYMRSYKPVDGILRIGSIYQRR